MTDTLNWTLLSVFIPTFFATSVSPGLCMTLALTTGMALGVRRSLWMMLGELIGVGLVAIAAVVGVAAVLLSLPALFAAAKLAGGGYLVYIGWQTWRAEPRLELDEHQGLPRSRAGLATQGFVTAVANPKGWALCVALLPPFIDASRPMWPQLSTLVVLMLLIEWICLMLYALGGRSLGRWLAEGHHLRNLNRVMGALLMAVGVWLAIG